MINNYETDENLISELLDFYGIELDDLEEGEKVSISLVDDDGKVTVLDEDSCLGYIFNDKNVIKLNVNFNSKITTTNMNKKDLKYMGYFLRSDSYLTTDEEFPKAS